MKTNEEQKVKNEDVVKNEDILKSEDVLKGEDVVNNDELESLEGGVSVKSEAASTACFGLTGCCVDILTSPTQR